MDSFWKTAISRVQPGEILVRGYPIEELVRQRSFGDVVFMLLTGELPLRNEGKLVEAIIIACCEHSLASPSAAAVRFVASAGVPLQTAVAAGVSAIGDTHGGAIEPCARILQGAVNDSHNAEQVFADLKAAGKRLPGFGHRVHRRQDPRVIILLELAEEYSLMGPHATLAQELEKSAAKALGRALPMNVDGVIAALLCDMGIDPALGKAFFIIGRAPGYVAHAHEQVTRERPFKAPSHDQIEYTGPPKRPVPPPQ